MIECKLIECGLIMCIMCYSQFGVKIAKDRCVFHIEETFLGIKEVKGIMKNYHEVLGEKIGFDSNIVLRQRSHK